MAEEMPATLPGMGGAGVQVNGLARAAAELIRELRAQQLIEPKHVLTVQLVEDLALVAGKAAAKGQAAAMAMATKELREAMELLPMPADAGDALTEFMTRFEKETAS